MRVINFVIFLFCFLLPSVPQSQQLFELKPYARTYSLTGFTGPQSTVILSFEIAGKIEQVLVDVGDAVPADGKIASLDATFVRLDLDRNTILQQKAHRQLQHEEKTLARYEALITKNSTAQATYDEAQLRKDLLTMELGRLEKEEASLRERLKRHTVYGPPGYHVIERFAEPGEITGQGEPVIKIGDFKTPVVQFFLTVEELAMLGNMQLLELYLPELDVSLPAKVLRVSPDIDDKSRKIKVDLQLDPSAEAGRKWLRGGLRSNLEITGKAVSNLYLVPYEALVNRYDANWLTTAGGEKIKVTIVGRAEESSQAIVSGEELLSEQKYLIKPQQ